MADKKVTELNLHTSPTLSDVIPIVNNQTTKKITYGTLYNSIRLGLVSESVDITSLNEFTSSIQNEVDVLSSQTGSYITSIPSGLVSGSSQIDIEQTTNYATPLVSASISGSTITFEDANTTQTELILPTGLGQSGLGWARYDDTQYTTSSHFDLDASDNEVTLPNNSGFKIEDHIHSSISFYDSGSQLVRAENENDVYFVTIVMLARVQTSLNAFMRLQLDVDSTTPYERVGRDIFFGRGDNEWHEIHEVFQYYSESDFVTNGAQWKVQAFNRDVDIANIKMFIQRTQNHGGE